MEYEEMQEYLDGKIKTDLELEMWHYWVAKDEQYRLARASALLGWAIALVTTIGIFFK